MVNIPPVPDVHEPGQSDSRRRNLDSFWRTGTPATYAHHDEPMGAWGDHSIARQSTALDNTCTLNCTWGGVIQIMAPGQFTEMIP